MKIKLSVLQKFIELEKDNIQKLDEKQLPDVIIELQLEEYHKYQSHLTSAREVVEIDENVIERVFSCWSFDERFVSWMEGMRDMINHNTIFMQMHNGILGNQGSFHVALKSLFYLAAKDNRVKMIKAFPEFFGQEVPEFGIYEHDLK